MILEGIVTTVNPDGTANIAPMGPLVDREITRLVFRPYDTSKTFQNLLRTRQGVFHVVDDVELLARAAVDRLDSLPRMQRAGRVEGWIISDACRWFAFEVREIDQRERRGQFTAEVVDRGRLRDFFGFNRAKHAVLEAAILASRTGILPAADIAAEMRRLAVIVDKTAGPAERRAFDFLGDFINQALSAPRATSPAYEAPDAAPDAAPRG